MNQSTLGQTILRDLGDGLILRRATPEDADALSEFNGRIHANPDSEEPDPYISTWVRDLLERPHPTFSPGDFTVVEETETGKIVSSCNLISQTWSYAGIPFGVGRPELVGTLRDRRRGGLVRAQFDVLHQWSAERGEMVQAITGIPFYYRQFGYEMTVDLGGGRVGYRPHVPKLPKDETEPYRVREATEADLPFIADLYAQAQRRFLLSAMRDEAMWRLELSGRSPNNVSHRELRIIETPEGEAVGYLAHPAIVWGPTQAITQYELAPGVSWLAVTPTVIRYAWATGEQNVARMGKEEALGAFAFDLGADHPVYTVAKDAAPRIWEPYAWYIRVPDVAGFLRHIAPVLEERLAASLMAGHTGELKISFYRSGVRLVWEKGRLQTVESWQPTHEDQGNVALPNLTFLHLLFGHRTYDELRYVYADCWNRDDAGRALLLALFPKQPSVVWPIA